MRILSKKVTSDRLNQHPESLMRNVKERPDEYPQPVRIGPNSIGFIESEVDAFIEARIRERDERGYRPKPVNPRENAARAAQRDAGA